MGSRKNKQKTGIVYSTDPAFEYKYDEPGEEETLPPDRQTLYVSVDRKQRKGKSVTIVAGFAGTTEDLKELARDLKKQCTTGGTVKDGEIQIQGDFREKIIRILNDMGYPTKRKGG